MRWKQLLTHKGRRLIDKGTAALFVLTIKSLGRQVFSATKVNLPVGGLWYCKNFLLIK
jgi:hypothetical protein